MTAGGALRLPLEDPVMIFAAAMAAFVAVPLLMERLRVPGMIGLILAGAALGPNGFGVLARGETIVLLGTVGLLYLMFMAGVEIDLHEFRRSRRESLGFGALTFLLPQFLGIAVGRLLGYGWAASILLASLFASHTLVSYPIASRLGIAKNRAVTATVGGTIVTDAAALLVLAVVAASARGSLDAAFWLRLTLSLAAFVALVLWAVPRLGRRFLRAYGNDPAAEYTFVLAALFASAVLAEAAGVEPIIGAFLAGIAINRLVPETGVLANRLHFFGNAFFVPFFLFSVGMLLDVRVLAGSARVWQVMAAMTLTVVAAKALAAWAARRAFGYSADEGWMVFGLSVPQAAATLAAALVGYRLQIFDTAVLNGAILMIVVTCTLGPWATERWGRRLAVTEARAPYRPAEARQRILVAVSSPLTAGALTDLALLLRDASSAEPLHPLVVVPGWSDADEAAPQVAAAEKLLSSAVARAAAADVPVAPLARVDFNYARGIARAITETRSNTVVVGWDRRRARRFALGAPVVEQLTERMQQLVVVARLEPVLAVPARVVLVLPPCGDRGAGLCEALHVVKLLASRSGATVRALAVECAPEDYARAFREVKPDVPVELARTDAGRGLAETLRGAMGRGEMVVLLAGRRGTLAWDRRLARLPAELDRAPGAFLVVYPPEPTPPRSEVLEQLAAASEQ